MGGKHPDTIWRDTIAAFDEHQLVTRLPEHARNALYIRKKPFTPLRVVIVGSWPMISQWVTPV